MIHKYFLKICSNYLVLNYRFSINELRTKKWVGGFYLKEQFYSHQI